MDWRIRASKRQWELTRAGGKKLELKREDERSVSAPTQPSCSSEVDALLSQSRFDKDDFTNSPKCLLLLVLPAPQYRHQQHQQDLKELPLQPFLKPPQLHSPSPLPSHPLLRKKSTLINQQMKKIQRTRAQKRIAPPGQALVPIDLILVPPSLLSRLVARGNTKLPRFSSEPHQLQNRRRDSNTRPE